MTAQTPQQPHQQPNAPGVDSEAIGRLTEALAAAIDTEWTRPEHGCDGTEQSCAETCPIPAYQRMGLDELRDAAVAAVAPTFRAHVTAALAEVESEKDQVRADALAVCAMVLGKVVDYWDGRPLSTGHGVHLYQDVIDVLRGIEGDRDHNLQLVRDYRDGVGR